MCNQDAGAPHGIGIRHKTLDDCSSCERSCRDGIGRCGGWA